MDGWYWLSDGRIIAENSRWTPVEPGKISDWRQHTSIRDIFAACEEGGVQLEHCMQGTRPAETWAGGRRRKPAVPTSKGGASAAESGAKRGRSRPRNPPAVERDMPEEAIVREKLIKITIDQLQQLCAEMSVARGRASISMLC